ncbi:MAG: PIN domain-containing protein [Actinobacteria bacterium]|nr:PIN domain-containing protein [Actinomycetota bacterium]
MRPQAVVERVFLDTNVLVYVFDPDAVAKQTCARGLLLDHLGSSTLALSTQVLLEFYWTVTRKPEIPLPHAVAAGFARQLLAAHVVTPSAALVAAAIERSGASTLSIWDALILEAAESCGASVLYTEDKHLLSARAGIEIVDPFVGLGEPATD